MGVLGPVEFMEDFFRWGYVPALPAHHRRGGGPLQLKRRLVALLSLVGLAAISWFILWLQLVKREVANE